ncbi:hypothetical protein UlMin_027086 [Ulmus minor]
MEINLEKLAFDLDFHPSENLVSATLVNGDLLLYRFSSDSTPQKVLEVHAHTESCRPFCFIDDGCAILTGSPNCSILATDVETGGTIALLEDAHGEAINKIINLYQSKIASGDDRGCIKVWDNRQCSCCGTYQAHEDYVSDMTFVPDTMKLLGTRLSVCNLQKEVFSKEELLSVFLVNKIILIWKWGEKNSFYKMLPNIKIDLKSNKMLTSSLEGQDCKFRGKIVLDKKTGSVGGGCGVLEMVGVWDVTGIPQLFFSFENNNANECKNKSVNNWVKQLE